MWTDEFGVPHPTGVAYAPKQGQLLVADVQGANTSVLRLTPGEDPQGTLSLPRLADPNTLAFDAEGNDLTALDGETLISATGREVQTSQPDVSQTNVSALALRDPQGATYDPDTGRWFVLDDGTDTIVAVPSAGQPSAATTISLRDLGAARFRGLAFNPADGLLYVSSPDQDLLYGVDLSGSVEKTYSLASLDLMNPSDMTFAPSADTTDSPSTQHLFIADAGSSSRLGGVTEVTLAAEATAAAPTVTATYVRTIATSAWTPASPDPSGIEYLPGTDRFAVCDSEVEEVTGAGYQGVNLWQATRAGTVTDTGTTYPAFSKEPTGLGYDPGSNTLFISDDSAKKVWVDKTGPDGRFGTSDDVVTFISAAAYGSGDTEDPEFDASSGQPTSGHLFFLDGTNTEIYDVDPVNGVFGDGNDVMTHFDIGQFGPTDWEGLGSDPTRNTLLVGARSKKVYEVTKTGTLLRIIDLSGISGLRYVSGLVMAPASDGSGRLNIYVVDRNIDNGSNPAENDGRIVEVSIPSSDALPTVSITDPVGGSTVTGTVSVEADAWDDLGVTQVQFFDGSTSLGTDTNAADGWSVPWDTTAATEGSHALTGTATDTIGQTTTSATVNVTVDNLDSPPSVMLTSPSNGSALKGTVTVQADASDDKGVAQVEFFLDGLTRLGLDTDGSNGWSAPWDTTTPAGEGPHTLTAVATDTLNQTNTSAAVNVTVDNTAPTSVAITAPTSGQTVSQTVTVQATASDGQGVASVQFLLDGSTDIGTDTDGSNGWSISWNTQPTTNGTYGLTAVAFDAAGNATTSEPVSVNVDNPLTGTLDIPIATSLDDVEEYNAKGSVTATSSDLDMMLDGTRAQRAIGLRFIGVTVPQGATIVNAYIQFQSDEAGSSPASLLVKGQASDDAPVFAAVKLNVTSRPTTTAAVAWVPAVWTAAGLRGPAQRTPDLRTVLQEIVGRPGWAPGNAVALIITGSGTGTRVAEAFDGTFAPVLHVEYGMS